ncbi:antibiotic biosynthesis monooxygenase [Streptomyces sp. PU-14G]|uniref:antibiotic biosynthesis monooxygenase n=1 Tax=Streptomyces sp. PU-14G TaxID=2800808 RepID=UPI0034DFB50A
MSRRVEGSPEVARAPARVVVLTTRHVGDGGPARGAAEAVARRGDERWPEGLLSWSLLESTDGQALMAYEQWSDDTALDSALSGPAPYEPGIPGAEPSAPVRYRLYRSHLGGGQEREVGCVVTPVFDVDGPARQRRFVDEIFAMTQGTSRQPGLIAAHFHLSTDGTRVVNYAEWTDERSHAYSLTAEDPAGLRRRIGEFPGVRPCGFRRWFPHAALAPARADDGR